MANKVLVATVFDDDGISGYDTVRGILNARGLKGSFAVISSTIGIVTGGYDHMDASEMRTMKAEGHTFHNHTKTHQQGVLPTDTQANCYTEINDCRSALISNGLADGISEDIFCAPYGEWGANYYLAAAQAGVKMYRGTVYSSGFTPMAYSNAILAPTQIVGCIDVPRTAATSLLTGQVDRAIAKNVNGNGGVLIFLYHHIVTSPAAVSIERSTANFTTEMDYLQTKQNAGLVESVTLTDLYLRCKP